MKSDWQWIDCYWLLGFLKGVRLFCVIVSLCGTLLLHLLATPAYGASGVSEQGSIPMRGSVQEVVVDKVFEFRVWEFTPPIDIRSNSLPRRSYRTPEEAAQSQWLAMMAGDADSFLLGWDDPESARLSNTEAAAKARELWSGLARRGVRLLRRVEAGPFVIIEDEVGPPHGPMAGKDAAPMRGDISFVQEDGSWRQTNRFADDPVRILWRTPSRMISRLARRASAETIRMELRGNMMPTVQHSFVLPEPPCMNATGPQIGSVTARNLYRYNVSEYGVSFHWQAGGTYPAGQRTAELAVVRGLSAMSDSDYERYVAGWDAKTRREYKKKPRSDAWEREVAALRNARVRLLRRADTLGYVIIEYQIDKGRPAVGEKHLKQDDVVLKKEDGRWVYTHDLDDDPVRLLWRTRTRWKTVLVRKAKRTGVVVPRQNPSRAITERK